MNFPTPVSSLKISDISDRVYEAFRGSSLAEGPRPYIGASILGHHCDRYIWLNFRWAFYYQLPKSGRMELLLRRGDREESTVKENLQCIGLWPKFMLWEQLDIDYGCHVKGHPDGVIPEGVISPESKTPHNLEIKTHNEKSFDDLVKNGVRISKPQHYVQMQLEMYGEKYIAKVGDIERSLYYAVCKNDDRIYTERIALDKEYAEKFIDRGHRLALADDIPDKCSDKPDWYKCKMCPYHNFCHGGNMLPEVNCRTCAHSTAKEDGTWYCELYKRTIPEENQRMGCKAHAFHPGLVPNWKLDPDKSTDWSVYYHIPEYGWVLNGYEGKSSEAISRELTGGAEYLETKYKAERLSREDPDIPF